MLDRRGFLTTSSAIVAAGLTTQAGQMSHAQSPPGKERLSREEFKGKLLECLGGIWPDPCPLEAKIEREQQEDGYRLLWIRYSVEPDDRVPAVLLVPDSATDATPAPGVAVWHQHAGQWHLGKSEPAGLAGNPMHHTGVALAKLGYVVICPDALCFEERQDPEKKLKGGAYERFEFLRQVVAGRCMAWKNILDMRRAVDFLVSRPEVDGERLGCYGHSMGSTHTWLVGPWEPRLKCLVGNCCLPTYGAIHRTKLLHCFPNFIPGIHQFGDTPDIASLIAPRYLHMNFGEKDRGSPIEEVRKGVEQIEESYAKLNAKNRFSYFIEKDTGHVLSETMWRRTKATFANAFKT